MFFIKKNQPKKKQVIQTNTCLKDKVCTNRLDFYFANSSGMNLLEENGKNDLNFNVGKRKNNIFFIFF